MNFYCCGETMILVIGGNGFVGSEICAHLQFKGIPFSKIGRDDNLLHHISNVDAVINAAGYTGKPNVDACELDKENCLLGNVILPTQISEICEKLEKPLVHVSSGCIYQGSRNWGDDDQPNFDLSFYSFSKAAAERILRNTNTRIMRIRMPFVDGIHPRCVLKKLSTYDKWLDGHNSITYLPEAAVAAVELLKAPPGIYNATNPGVITNGQIADYMGLKPDWWDWEEFYMVGHTPRSFCTLDSTKIQEYANFTNVHTLMKKLFTKRKAA